MKYFIYAISLIIPIAFYAGCIWLAMYKEAEHKKYLEDMKNGRYNQKI